MNIKSTSNNDIQTADEISNLNLIDTHVYYSTENNAEQKWS